MTTSMPRFFLHILLITVCLLGFAGSAWAAEVIIGTGAAPAENIFKKIKFPIYKALRIKLTVMEAGPVQAMKDLEAGKVDCAVAGMSFADLQELMKKNGHEVADPSLYRTWVIGQDNVRVLTNLDAPVKSLSKKQLAAIFSGTTTNWSQVGGPDKPIVVVLGSRIPGVLSVFQKQAMDNAAFTKNAIMGTTAEDIKSLIIRNPGAIGLGTVAQIDYLVNSPEIPEIGRPITLITKGEPSSSVEKMIKYISAGGRRYIVR